MKKSTIFLFVYVICLLLNSFVQECESAVDFREPIVAGDINNDGSDEIIIDFGPQYGIWIRYERSENTWEHLHNLNPDSIVTGDLDGNGKVDIIIDFGSTYGIWVRYNNSTWQQLHGLSPDDIVTGDLDGNGKDYTAEGRSSENMIWLERENEVILIWACAWHAFFMPTQGGAL